MIRVTLVTQPDCTLCDHAKEVLARVNREHPLRVTELAFDSPRGRELATRHGVLFAPGVFLDGQLFGFGRLSERKLRRTLRGYGGAHSRWRLDKTYDHCEEKLDVDRNN